MLGQGHVNQVTSYGTSQGTTGQNTGADVLTVYAHGKAIELLGSWEETYNTEERTVYGLSLYDSSFPIHNEDKLIQVTNALKDLNRKTLETVNVTIYDFEHLIDFNDKISFNGATYFLARNTANSTSRVRNEQNLTLVRWY